jgi:hypothetical protein
MFDDSFQHEAWYEHSAMVHGQHGRLVLIVDVWHPQLLPAQREQLTRKGAFTPWQHLKICEAVQ